MKLRGARFSIADIALCDEYEGEFDDVSPVPGPSRKRRVVLPDPDSDSSSSPASKRRRASEERQPDPQSSDKKSESGSSGVYQPDEGSQGSQELQSDVSDDQNEPGASGKFEDDVSQGSHSDMEPAPGTSGLLGPAVPGPSDLHVSPGGVARKKVAVSDDEVSCWLSVAEEELHRSAAT